MALSQLSLPSVVTFRLTNMRHENVNTQILDIISRFSQELLDGALISVTDDAVRVRFLPLD